MQAVTRYISRDRVEHSSKQTAETHCLDKAVLELAACLRGAGIDNAHGYATKIIANAVNAKSDGDLGKAYYQLFETVNWIKDSYRIERE